jgi:hypothetical protein
LNSENWRELVSNVLQNESKIMMKVVTSSLTLRSISSFL